MSRRSRQARSRRRDDLGAIVAATIREVVRRRGTTAGDERYEVLEPDRREEHRLRMLRNGWRKIRYSVHQEFLRRPNLVCHWCLKPLTKGNLTVDHIVALADGGDNRRANLVPACGRCNGKKSSHFSRRRDAANKEASEYLRSILHSIFSGDDPHYWEQHDMEA